MMAPETVVTVDHNKPTPQQGPPPQQDKPLDWIKINIDYFKTPPGLLKIIQLVLGILCMSLAAGWVSPWFMFVAVTSFITTVMWSVVYFLSVREALRIPINWVLSELISTGIETVFYFTAFIALFASAAAHNGHFFSYGANIAAAVFGIFNTGAYAASSFLLFQEHRASTGAGAA